MLNPVWELRAVKKQGIYLATQGIYKVTLPTEWAAPWQTRSDAADAVGATAEREACDHYCNSISTSMLCSEEIKVWD